MATATAACLVAASAVYATAAPRWPEVTGTALLYFTIFGGPALFAARAVAIASGYPLDLVAIGLIAASRSRPAVQWLKMLVLAQGWLLLELAESAGRVGVFAAGADREFTLSESGLPILCSLLWSAVHCPCSSPFSSARAKCALLAGAAPVVICPRHFTHPSSDLSALFICIFSVHNMSCDKGRTAAGFARFVLHEHAFPLAVALFDIRYWYTARALAVASAAAYADSR